MAWMKNCRSAAANSTSSRNSDEVCNDPLSIRIDTGAVKPARNWPIIRQTSLHSTIKENIMAADLGIKEKDRLKIVEALSKLLADTYTLYLKTHNFHWNVTGPMFQTLHLMFQAQYTELWTNIDLIAERIRSLDDPAPGTYAQF